MKLISLVHSKPENSSIWCFANIQLILVFFFCKKCHKWDVKIGVCTITGSRLVVNFSSSIHSNHRLLSNSTHSVGVYKQNNLERRQNRWPNVTFRTIRLAFRYDSAVNYCTDLSVNFETVSTICQHCNRTFRYEPPRLCCASKSVKLP